MMVHDSWGNAVKFLSAKVFFLNIHKPNAPRSDFSTPNKKGKLHLVSWTTMPPVAT